MEVAESANFQKKKKKVLLRAVITKLCASLSLFTSFAASGGFRLEQHLLRSSKKFAELVGDTEFP
jgi:hypothetical protein